MKSEPVKYLGVDSFVIQSRGFQIFFISVVLMSFYMSSQILSVCNSRYIHVRKNDTVGLGYLSTINISTFVSISHKSEYQTLS